MNLKIGRYSCAGKKPLKKIARSISYKARFVGCGLWVFEF